MLVTLFYLEPENEGFFSRPYKKVFAVVNGFFLKKKSTNKKEVTKR
jgi:hypothetical protein